MSLENLQNDEHRVLLEKMAQIKLAELHSEDLFSWIDEHANDFRNVINEHPELIDKFEDEPEQTLKELDDYLYQ